MEEEKTLFPKCILKFNLEASIWEIKLIDNSLILLAFTLRGWALVFLDLRSYSERKILLPEEVQRGECPDLFCLPAQNLILILSRPSLLGYSLDGVFLFRFSPLLGHQFLLSNSRSSQFSFVEIGDEKTFFSLESLDLRKLPCTFHIKRSRCVKNPDPDSYRPPTWYVVQDIEDKFGIFGCQNEDVYWWRETGESPAIKLSPSSVKRTSNKILFYPPKDGLVMISDDCLLTYSFVSELKFPWKFSRRWNLGQNSSFAPFLWNTFLGVEGVASRGAKILLFDVSKLFPD